MLERVRGLGKGTSSVIATVSTLVGLLLALGLIRPFGQNPAEAVASAAEKIEAGSSKLHLEVSITKSSAPHDELASFSADGEFDYRTKRGSLSYDYSQTPGAEDVPRVPTVFNRRIVYMRFPPSRGIPRDKPWIRMDLTSVDRQLQERSIRIVSGLRINDPSQALDYLKKTADIKEVGDEPLFGEKTTHYRGTIPPEQLGGEAARRSMRPLSTDAWIDEGGILRQLALSGSDASERFKVTLQLHDFGLVVRADPPPADRITDLKDVLGR